jgi:hypothetical protein
MALSGRRGMQVVLAARDKQAPDLEIQRRLDQAIIKSSHTRSPSHLTIPHHDSENPGRRRLASIGARSWPIGVSFAGFHSCSCG